MDDAMKTLLALKAIKDGPHYPAFKLFLQAQSQSALAGMDGAEPGRTQQLSGKVLAFEWLQQYLEHQLEMVLAHLRTENNPTDGGAVT